MESEIFLPYQKRWMLDKSQVKIWEKSRRIGASFCEAAASVLLASARNGADVYYISYNQEMTSGFISDCAKWANAFHISIDKHIGDKVLTRDDGKDIHVYDIPFYSGHKIVAFSSNPRNIRSKGRPGDWVIIDEAAHVDDIEDMLKAALAVTMWGGEVHLLSTHNGMLNPFNRLIQEVKQGQYDYSIHKTTLDLALQEGLYKRICQVSGKKWTQENQDSWRSALMRRYRPREDEELFCIPATSGVGFVIQDKIVVEDFVPDPDLWDGPYFGADWGFSRDPSTIIKVWIFDDNLYVENENWGVGIEIDQLPDFFDEVPESRYYAIRADSARPDTISYLNRNGFQVLPSEKGPGSIEDGITHLRGYNRIIIHSRCRHTIEEGNLWRYKMDRLSNTPTRKPEPGYDHCWDAIRYSLEPIMKYRDMVRISEDAFFEISR